MKKITKKEINERIKQIVEKNDEKIIYKSYIKEYDKNDITEIIAEFVTVSKNDILREYILFNSKVNNRIDCYSNILLSDGIGVKEY